jgi:hypothetical protein
VHGVEVAEPADQIAGAEVVLAGGDRPVRVGRFEQEVDDAQAESEVGGAGPGVDERAGGDARDVGASTLTRQTSTG